MSDVCPDDPKVVGTINASLPGIAWDMRRYDIKGDIGLSMTLEGWAEAIERRATEHAAEVERLTVELAEARADAYPANPFPFPYESTP